MEGDTEEPTRRLITVDFHYDGVFTPKPLKYHFEKRASVRDIDFEAMQFSDLEMFVRRLLPDRVSTIHGIVLYYKLHKYGLSQGLNIIHNDGDYKEFIQTALENDNKIEIFIDHHKEPIFDWIEEEDPEWELEYSDCEDEVESNLSDDHVEHEKDDLDLTISRRSDDPFLNILIPEEDDHVDGDEVEVDDGPPVFPVFNENVPWNQMAPLKGMKFAKTNDLKTCMSNYAVAHGYQLWYERNEKDRIHVRCCKNRDPSCPFRLWASWMQNERTFQIKSLIDTHNCSRAFKLGAVVTYKWIGKRFVHEILKNPKISLRKMKSEISEKFMLNVSLGQCGNARKYALGEIEGCLKDHYAKLWDYGEEVRRSNPGSTVIVDVETNDSLPGNEKIFEKFYVCFKGVKDGWVEGCRRIICLDGCFLKGVCRGQLISAIGRDANNHMYPLAWAVVNVENKDTWEWFIDLLMDDIGGANGSGLTFMSDGHKGLMEAIKDRVPAAEHRLCARHIYANLVTRHWTVKDSGYQIFDVSLGEDRYGVDLQKRECACRGWQLSGIPCLHGIAAICRMNHDPENYVDACFTKETFLTSYRYSIYPLNGSGMWPHVEGLNTILL